MIDCREIDKLRNNYIDQFNKLEDDGGCSNGNEEIFFING